MLLFINPKLEWREIVRVLFLSCKIVIQIYRTVIISPHSSFGLRKSSMALQMLSLNLPKNDIVVIALHSDCKIVIQIYRTVIISPHSSFGLRKSSMALQMLSLNLPKNDIVVIALHSDFL